jgi:hypothetical protein
MPDLASSGPVLAGGDSKRREFIPWLKSPMWARYRNSGLALLLTAVFSIWRLLPNALNPEESTAPWPPPAGTILAAIQAAACLLMMWMMPRPLHHPSATGRDQDTLTKRASERIHVGVLWMFGLWVIYYVAMAVTLWIGNDALYSATTGTISTLNALWIFWVYLEIARITLDDPAALKSGSSAETLQRYLADTRRHRTLSATIACSLVVVLWLARYGPSRGSVWEPIEAAKYAHLIVGILGGIAFALVTGCFTSGRLDPGPIVLSLLYLYAVIQPFAAEFEKNIPVRAFCTSLALPLKILFWLVVVWAFTTGELWEYAKEGRGLQLSQGLEDGDRGDTKPTPGI